MGILHRSNKSWKKSVYIPINKQKYVGSSVPIMRSGWERKYARYLDLSENVIAWASEEPKIPYLNPVTGTVWNYSVDFTVKFKDKFGNVKVCLVEIKPLKQTMPPKNKNKQRLLQEQQAYSVNVAKWEAAKNYCASRGWEFKILTELDGVG